MAPEIRTLVVEDHPDICRLIDTVLTLSDDYVVVGSAANGYEGIERARELQPDLVLLDVTMPVLDGIAALPELRRAAPQAVVVYLTALDEWRVEETPEGYPRADGFVSKSVLPWGLVPELEKVRL